MSCAVSDGMSIEQPIEHDHILKNDEFTDKGINDINSSDFFKEDTIELPQEQSSIEIDSTKESVLGTEEKSDANASDDDFIKCDDELPHVLYGGIVAPGYESVRDMFFRNFRVGHIEECAQVSVYVKGKLIINLWANRVKRTPKSSWGLKKSAKGYGPKSLQNIFSSGKVITSLVVAMLVDKGLLRYDQKVTDIWPEYGCLGKEDTTIAHVMKHEAGLPFFKTSIPASDLTPERIKTNAVGKVIEKQVPAFKPGSKRMYHAVTRGWIVNEIVRRVDPKGRTVGEFTLEEISTPLGIENELRVGLPDDMHDSVVPLTKRPGIWAVRQFITPKVFGGGRIPGATGLLPRFGWGTLHSLAWVLSSAHVMPRIGVSREKKKNPRSSIKNAMKLFNAPEVRRGEIPSANFHASAYALAKVANEIVQSYCYDQSIILSREGSIAAHANPVKRPIFVVAPMTMTDGGWCFFGKLRDNYVGWMGLGGSCLQWHFEEEIAFGYAMNCSEPVLWNARGKDLQHEILKCARKLRKSDKVMTKSEV